MNLSKSTQAFRKPLGNLPSLAVEIKDDLDPLGFPNIDLCLPRRLIT
jgi:hypothetical protein